MKKPKREKRCTDYAGCPIYRLLRLIRHIVNAEWVPFEDLQFLTEAPFFWPFLKEHLGEYAGTYTREQILLLFLGPFRRNTSQD